MRRIIPVICWQLYAIALAVLQWQIGVRTDEAKYLLDIPYPHPPLARFLISLSDSWSFHELFWRVVFATIVVQAIWLIVDLLRDAQPPVRLAVVFGWLFSAAVVLQAGTVMMAVLTALQLLVFVWLFLRDREPTGREYLIALFWLACLFTAYQAILFTPLVWAVFSRSRIASWKQWLLVGIPVLLLVLYTFTNPLVPASMMNHAGKDVGASLIDHVLAVFRLWAIGGSIVLSIGGIIGLFLQPKAGLLLSFGLITAYVLLSQYDYYAILFTPLFVAGGTFLFRRAPRLAIPFLVLHPIGLAVMLFMALPLPVSNVDEVYQSIELYDGAGEVLIAGGFGHEWQYGTTSTVRRYRPGYFDGARAVICLQPCADMQVQFLEWMRIPDVPVEAWVRRSEPD